MSSAVTRMSPGYMSLEGSAFWLGGSANRWPALGLPHFQSAVHDGHLAAVSQVFERHEDPGREMRGTRPIHHHVVVVGNASLTEDLFQRRDIRDFGGKFIRVDGDSVVIHQPSARDHRLG